MAESLLIGPKILAELLSVSRTTIYEMRRAGELPDPVAVAGVKWSRSEIADWIAAGCPNGSTWNTIKADAETARGAAR